jgi:hypothetical protein
MDNATRDWQQAEAVLAEPDAQVTSSREGSMKNRPSKEDVLWMVAGAGFLALLLLVLWHFRQDPTQQLAFKASRVDLVGRMQVALASASEAEKSAVLAITDQDSPGRPERTEAGHPRGAHRGCELRPAAQSSVKLRSMTVHLRSTRRRAAPMPVGPGLSGVGRTTRTTAAEGLSNVPRSLAAAMRSWQAVVESLAPRCSRAFCNPFPGITLQFTMRSPPVLRQLARA